MRIDAHQHFWIYNPHEYDWIDNSMGPIRRDFLPRDLEPLLGCGGFRGSVVVQARQSLKETDWLLKLADQNPFVLGVVGWVDLCSPQAREQLERFAGRSKLIGIRHIVQSEPDDFLLRPEFLRGISILEEFDLAYDILIYAKHLSIAAEFVKRFPRQRFVLDHLAKPPVKSGTIEPWARCLRELAACPNVYAKLSGLVTEADWQSWRPEDISGFLEVAFDCFGVDRLMIGSDWPVCLVASSYDRTIKVIKDYLNKYSAENGEAVLGGNAAAFWRLPRGGGGERG
jgi:L-fuconolactonase